MTKRKIHIDDFFRRGLGTMQMPVDGNDWAAMQAALAAAQKRRKRRFLLWWMMGAGMLVIGLGITYTLVNQNDTSLTTVTHPALVTVEPQTSNTSSSENITNGNPSNTSTGSDNDALNENITSSTDNSSTNTPQSQSGNNNGSKKPKNKPAANKGKDNGSPETPDLGNKKDTPQTPITPATNNGGDKGNNGLQTDDGSSTPDKPKETLLTPSVPDGVTTQQDSNVNDPNTPTPQEIVTKDSSDKDNKPTTDNGVKAKIPSPFSLGINLGPAISAFGIGNTTTYGNIRNGGDKAGVGYNGAITLNYKLKNFTFITGLGINSVGGSGRYRYTRQIYDSIPVYSPPPNPVVVGYFYQNFRDTSLNYNIQNRFTYITLPVGAAYSWEIKPDKWGITAGLGIQLQRLASTSGEYINPGNLYKFDLGTNNDFIKKWNLSARAKIGCYYIFSNTITFETAFTYSRAGDILKNVNVAVLPRSMGVEAGIKFNLKK